MRTDREMLLSELLATMSDRGELEHTPSEDELSLRLEELSDDELQKLYSMGRFVRTLDAVGAFTNSEDDTEKGKLDPKLHHSNRHLHENIGKYIDLELVGVGGFANVYRAFDAELKRFVALKIPHADRIDQRECLAIPASELSSHFSTSTSELEASSEFESLLIQNVRLSGAAR